MNLNTTSICTQPIAITDDNVYESNEVFIVKFTYVGVNKSALITIIDNDLRKH